MRKYYLVMLCVSFSGLLFGQLSEGGMPYSLQMPTLKSAQPSEGIMLKKLNIDKLLKKDLKEKIDNRYSIYKDVTIDIKKEGNVVQISDGKVWQYKVTVENGYSIGLFFKKYKLPDGAKLFIYNPDYSIIYGAFTSKNNKEYGTFTVADFPGTSVIIEYFEPSNASFEGELVIGKIGQSYRDIRESSLKSADADNNIDVNCPEGDLVQLQKHAVAKMTFEDNNAGYLCSGSLINNTSNDGTPYFLTARHCISSSIVASTLVTYYNFENKDCNGLSFAGQSLSGATLKATYKPSDFTLLLLGETPTDTYQPYYEGWNAASDSIVKSGTGIHHPSGREKKVALEYDNIISYPVSTIWDNNSTSPANTHWLVIYDKGFTEGGSSGSPLFDDKNRVIGQLHGGTANYDLYGKLSYSWETNSFSNAQLKKWLDPTSSGVKVLDGYYPSTNLVGAHFTTKFLSVCTGEPVRLKDGSVFSPTSWTWSFTPTTVNYLDGTTSHSQNPVVSFQNDGAYDVTLKVTKGANSNTRTRRSYITSGDTLSLAIRAQNTGDLCFNNFTKTTLFSSGADTGFWSIVNGANYLLIDSAASNQDSLVLVKNDSLTVDTSYVMTIQYTGFHGICKDSVQIDLNIIFPFNDNIENAYPLSLGENGPFTNACATTQTNEPNPPSGSCNSQTTWCPCEISDNILDNSVWFKFVAPSSGIIAINAPGFDDQIALYKADSASEILSGDSTLYGIIAANDDYFSEADNYSALITNAIVTPGETYWVQVDGSGCGAEGSFNITLYDHKYSPINGNPIIENDATSNLVIYPNPASSYFTLRSTELTGVISIYLITLDGKKIFLTETDSQQNGDYLIKLPETIIDGFYIITVSNGKSTYNSKLSVQR